MDVFNFDGLRSSEGRKQPALLIRGLGSGNAGYTPVAFAYKQCKEPQMQSKLIVLAPSPHFLPDSARVGSNGGCPRGMTVKCGRQETGFLRKAYIAIRSVRQIVVFNTISEPIIFYNAVFSKRDNSLRCELNLLTLNPLRAFPL